MADGVISPKGRSNSFSKAVGGAADGSPSKVGWALPGAAPENGSTGPRRQHKSKTKVGPSLQFRNAMTQLEAEYMREVTELKSEIARLRNKLQDSASFNRNGVSSVTSVTSVDMTADSVTSVDVVESAHLAALAPAYSSGAATSNGTAADLAVTEVDADDVMELNAALSAAASASADPSSPKLLAASEDSAATLGLGVVPSSPKISECPSSVESDKSGKRKFKEQAAHMLKITIVSASGLRSADWGIGASSDPYCVCEIHDKPWAVAETPVMERTLDPDWKHEDIIADYCAGDDLEFTVRDKDWGGVDDLLGRITLPSDQFWPNGFSGDLTLEEVGKKSDSMLTVKISEYKEDFSDYLLSAWREIPSNMEKDKSGIICTTFSLRHMKRGGSGSTHLTLANLAAALPSRFIVKPDSLARFWWDMCGIWVLLLDLIWIPMQVFDLTYHWLLETLNHVKLAYWNGDILFCFNTGFYGGDGKLIMRRRLIFNHYLRGWLLFDFFLVSMDWAMVIQEAVHGTAGQIGQNAGAARAGKLARAFRVLRLLRLMRLAKLRGLLYTLQSLIDSEWLTIVFVVGKNLLSIIFLNHYIACSWFIVGSTSSSGWVNRLGWNGEPYGYQYVLCLHWSLSQFTPGRSTIGAETNGERLFATTVLILSMVVATCFISSITSALGQIWSMNRYAATQSFLLKKFLNQNKISRNLGARVTRYIEGVIELRHTRVHPSKVEYLTLLSGPLNLELAKEMRMPRLNLHPLFFRYAKINPDVVGQVCSAAVSSGYLAKNDVLFKEGILAESMFFLGVGTLAYRYYTEHGNPKTDKVDSFGWFSEGVLWMPWLHRGQMKAVSHADVTYLNADKFVSISTSSEDVYKYVRACAYKFMASFDPAEATDIPAVSVSFKAEQQEAAGGDTADRVRAAEDLEVKMMHFEND